ncbi:alpha/beta fold hydrolase [Sorangium sp. So ce363]|uniref:alpha/beta fold hydrolase n=1 Tax=Sorangium sp. So ce363 TaxID=3133304 RepID=UPI003F5FC0C5
MTTTMYTVTVPDRGPAEVTVAAHGDGQPILLLHGGAGPQSVDRFAQALARREHARVIAPTHPGFRGTPRPEWLDSIPVLARLYRALLDQLDLTDVTVVGNSIGGWIAAELALLGSHRIRSIVLVDAVGIDVADQPIADVFSLPKGQLAERSYHDPARFRIDVTRLSEAQRAAMEASIASNFAALRIYGGSMMDPTLRRRLSAITVPTLIVWGDSDRISTPDYGRAYAAAIPGARFELLADTGHLPQVENPEALLTLVWNFAVTNAANKPGGACDEESP